MGLPGHLFSPEADPARGHVSLQTSSLSRARLRAQGSSEVADEAPLAAAQSEAGGVPGAGHCQLSADASPGHQRGFQLLISLLITHDQEKLLSMIVKYFCDIISLVILRSLETYHLHNSSSDMS